MNKLFQILIVILITILNTQNVLTQVENVPAEHPVYQFLKRMEVKQLISQYYDAVLPLSRKEVAFYLSQIEKQKDMLTNIEKEILDNLIIEFEYELNGSLKNSFFLIGQGDDVVSGMIRGTFYDKEKYLLTYLDSNVTLFINGLFTLNFSRTKFPELSDNATFIEGGPRMRGIIYKNLGYYFKLTNAAFWGNRDVLKRDKRIKQSFALGTLDSRNFDFIEGYLRYSGKIISAQLGRERILWGNSYGDKLYLSDYPRVFDAFRFDATYKKIRYNFLHAWILGKTKYECYAPYMDYLTVVPDKYFAAHRLEIALNKNLDIAVQEFTIYSNRPVDLGYLNPVTFFESVQRSRQERDNGFLAFDMQLRLWSGFELHTNIFFDDIHIPLYGKRSWANRTAYQAGMMTVDPIGLLNTNLTLEYTRVEPYMFAHNRSPENEYTSNDVLLGTQIGPNTESWRLGFDIWLSKKISIRSSIEIRNSGENVVDSTGNLIRNVGGDYKHPFRIGIDSETVKFLDGIYVRTYLGDLFINYEFVKEFFMDIHYQWVKIVNCKASHDFRIALRVDF